MRQARHFPPEVRTAQFVVDGHAHASEAGQIVARSSGCREIEVEQGHRHATPQLPPEVKQAVKAAIRSIAIEPATGEPLRGELEGLWKFRVRRYRLVYAVDRRRRVIRIFAVGHRRGIYEEVSERLRRPIV